MKNDKERRAFVEDDSNWIELHDLKGIRTQCLEYGDEEWYRIQIQRETQRYDFEKRNVVPSIEWMTLAMVKYKGNGEAGYMTADNWSITSIVDAMKRIDKKEKGA